LVAPAIVGAFLGDVGSIFTPCCSGFATHLSNSDNDRLHVCGGQRPPWISKKELRLYAEAIRGETSGDLLAPEHAMKALTLSIATQRSLRERRAIEL
jgi:hypothetical protein